MNDLLFSGPSTAANDVHTLLAYLRTEDTGQFLYRGQTRDYGSALLPSVFRGVLDETNIGTMDSMAEHGVASIRSVGTTFVGNYVSDVKDSQTRLTSNVHKSKEQREEIRQRLLDTFGYVLGTTLAQHYGFKSGGLDASTKPEIAAFFATRSPPHYREVERSTEGLGPGDRPGVIYRFDRSSQPQDGPALMDLNYLNAPGTLVLTDVLEVFESDIGLAESWRSLRFYYELFRTSKDRHLDLLQIPRSLVAGSRLGRQGAAIIIPDEIHLFSDRPVYGVHPIFGTRTIDLDHRYLVFQSVEDLRTRSGTKAFYFQHSSEPPDLEISPSDLWPNETDDLLYTVAYVLSSSFSCYGVQEKTSESAYDLFDPGVGCLSKSHIKNGIRSRHRSVDDFEDTLHYARLLRGDGERIAYYVQKAANAFARVHMSGDADLLSLAIKLAEQARTIDKTSVVLALFCNILYGVLGDKRKAQAMLGSAFDIVAAERRPDQDPIQGIEIVQNILKDLYRAQWSPNSFPGLLWEYYQSF